MSPQNRKKILYREGDILVAKNKEKIESFFNSPTCQLHINRTHLSDKTADYIIDKRTHNYKRGHVFYTYRISRIGYNSYKKELSELDINNLFICKRVLSIKRENLIKKICLVNK